MTAGSDVERIVAAYDAEAPLSRSATIPAAWYTDPRIADLERRAVFGDSWQLVGRADQLAEAGQFVTADIAGEPVVVVRGSDGALRAFYNVCRHHAAAVATEEAGRCNVLRCPYHGWTYGLDGSLKGTPDFDGVEAFDRDANGLVPLAVDCWESFVFVHLGRDPRPVSDDLGDAVARIAALDLGSLSFFERREYELACNWKVFVDNYLDGGYHVPLVHESLNTVIEYADYQIETAELHCLQWSPMRTGDDVETAAVRKGDAAYYYWFWPNLMLNWYEGVMDINLVLPLAVDRCRVVFDFYFADTGDEAAKRNSVKVAERVQHEDIGVCESVQRGLGSRAYDTGRLSVRREAGEQLFHRLLHAGLRTALENP